MEHPKQTQESMAARVMRFEELKAKGIPIMFIDSMLPGHMRMNYAVIGDTAAENPDYSIQRAITEPHRYQIGMAWAPPAAVPPGIPTTTPSPSSSCQDPGHFTGATRTTPTRSRANLC